MSWCTNVYLMYYIDRLNSVVTKNGGRMLLILLLLLVAGAAACSSTADAIAGAQPCTGYDNRAFLGREMSPFSPRVFVL
jgi:hypothetical protein